MSQPPAKIIRLDGYNLFFNLGHKYFVIIYTLFITIKQNIGDI